MAESSPHFNSILNRVREKLRSENVKLWLAPYTTSNDEPGKYPEVLFVHSYNCNLRFLRADFQDMTPKDWDLR